MMSYDYDLSDVDDDWGNVQGWRMGRYPEYGPWERTPWYLFWKKPWRRRVGYFGLPIDDRWQYCTHTDFLTMD